MPLDRTLRHLSALYQAREDPWGHLTTAYEQDKYATTIEALGDRRFGLGLEVGCGIGALTERLAVLCDRLVAIDCIPRALEQARRRLRAVPHVELVAGAAPGDLPSARPDLIVLSEVLYFMTEAEIDGLAAWCRQRAAPAATVIAVSWSGDTGEAFSGDASVERLAQGLPAPHWARRRSPHAGYVIDLFQLGDDW